MDLGQLQSQHQRIEALADQFLRAIANDNSPQPLGMLRWQFARELMGHLALEDRIFYPAMRRQGPGLLRDTAARLQVEMAPLADAFSAYMSGWSDERIAREWATFCRESRQIIKTVLNRVQKEERLLMPLLADAGLEPPQISRAN